MNDWVVIGIGAAVLLWLLFFATVHLAVRTFSRVRLGQILEARGREEWMARLVAHRTEITLATASLRTVLEVALLLIVARELRPAATGLEGGVHFALVFCLAAALVVVFGVALPNAWARYAGESLLARVIPVLHWCRLILWPVVRVLGFFDELVRRLSGAPRLDDTAEVERIEQELLKAVSEGQQRGALDIEEREMIEAVIELRNMHVGRIMTPRTEIVGVPSTAPIEEIKSVVAREGHSRLPVYQDTIDNILGMLYAKDLLTVEPTVGFDVTTLMRQVPFVPESKLLRALLHDLQEQKVQIAVVLDEYGGTAGLVTIEDILEELVGDIVDEYEPSEPEPIVVIDPDTAEVDARAHIDELNTQLAIGLPEDQDYETIGGFIFSTLGRIPSTGDEIEHENLRFKVLDAEDRRIKRVRVHVLRNGQNGQPG